MKKDGERQREREKERTKIFKKTYFPGRRGMADWNRDEDEIWKNVGKKRNSGEENGSRGKPRSWRGEQEELNSKNFSSFVVFSFFRRRTTRGWSGVRLIAIYVCRKQTNATNSKAWREGSTVLLLQRINSTTFILCAPFVIILQRKCYRRTLHDRVRAEIKSAIFVTEFEVRSG